MTWALLSLLIAQLYGAPLKTEGLIERTIIVENERGSGTGVILDTNIILTCKHLVGSRMFVNGIPAEVIRVDVNNDLALLKVSTSKVTPLKIAEKYSQDQEIFYIGNPLTHRFVIVRGRIVDVDGKDAYIDAHLTVGASGAPVYDMEGRLVGIVRALEGSPEKGFPFGVVIPADVINAFVH